MVTTTTNYCPKFKKNQSIPFVDILKNIFIIADYYTLWIAKLDLPHEHVSADQV